MEKARLSTIQWGTLVGLFLIFLVVAALSHNDYGIAWDEPTQVEIGQFNYQYLIGSSDTLVNYHDRFYGAAYEWPLYALQQSIGFDSKASLFNFRHLINHLIFLLSLGFFFALLFKLFHNFKASLLGVLMLYLHPRIFAHSFFNSKDIIFMSVFIIGLYTLFLLFEKQNKKRIIIHALISALLIDIRILGIILPALSFLIIIPSLLKWNDESRGVLRSFALYSILSIIFLYLFWPALWTDPLLLGKSFIRMSHFPFHYNVLFNGELIPATQVPWNYIPLWFGVTTPPFILLLSSIGFIWLLVKYFKQPEQTIESRKKWFILVLSSFPFDFVLLLIIMGSCLYDGWRQVYFLYPLTLISAVYAYDKIIDKLKEKKIARITVNALILIFITLTVIKIYKLHPYEQVYFNHFVSKKNENRRKTFDMDYWGLSYREGLEYISKNEKSDTIRICFGTNSGPANLDFLSSEDQKRFYYAPTPEKSDYFITGYRYHPQDYSYKNEVFYIKRDDNRILSVFKLKK